MDEITEVESLNEKYFAVGPFEHDILCPICGQRTQTRIHYDKTILTYLTDILCCISFFTPFVCVPFCLYALDDCGTNRHYCINCDGYLGSYHRIKN